MKEKVTPENIDDIKSSLNSDFKNTIKSFILDRIECNYEEQLVSEKITMNDIDEMAYIITNDEILLDTLDSTIKETIDDYFKENEISIEEI